MTPKHQAVIEELNNRLKEGRIGKGVLFKDSSPCCMIAHAIDIMGVNEGQLERMLIAAEGEFSSVYTHVLQLDPDASIEVDSALWGRTGQTSVMKLNDMNMKSMSLQLLAKTFDDFEPPPTAITQKEADDLDSSF